MHVVTFIFLNTYNHIDINKNNYSLTGIQLSHDKNTKKFHILKLLRDHINSGQRYKDKQLQERVVQLSTEIKDDFMSFRRKKSQLAKEKKDLIQPR